jgi:AraC family ethanolamine operon transcriptional activator
MIMPRDGEFESFSSPGFDIYNLSLSQQLLEKVAAERFGRLLQEMLPDGRLLCQHSGEPLTRLRSLLQLISIKLQEGKAMGAAHADFTIDSLMEEAAAFLALSCLTQGTSKSPPRPGAKKMQILDNVFSSLETTSAAGASVPALAAIAGVCRRSLENAFDDVLGVSPATYLKAMRLRHLHKDLLSGGPDYATVSGLMARHGFRHGGRAAGDYRAMFGESPRETLQRPG